MSHIAEAEVHKSHRRNSLTRPQILQVTHPAIVLRRQPAQASCSCGTFKKLNLDTWPKSYAGIYASANPSPSVSPIEILPTSAPMSAMNCFV
mmetsp:Transcript_42815/g.104039  ORF Transcript_42815/g.104039 Transcript_42815/m.104039 type:complete len:92 (-) Transcript_42815:1190-1465(-)